MSYMVLKIIHVLMKPQIILASVLIHSFFLQTFRNLPNMLHTTNNENTQLLCLPTIMR